MKIQRVVSNLLQSNFYIINENKNNILVDPAIASDICINGLVDYILLTHEHYDHISGVNYWKRLFPCAKVFCSFKSFENISNPRKNASIHFDAFCQIQTMIKDQLPLKNTAYSCTADEFFCGFKTIKWGKHIINAFHTPGHSEGSTIFLIDNEILFSGDTIFKNYKTQTRLYSTGNLDFKDITMPILKNLDKNILVYPGHFESFSLKDAYFMKGE